MRACVSCNAHLLMALQGRLHMAGQGPVQRPCAWEVKAADKAVHNDQQRPAS